MTRSPSSLRPTRVLWLSESPLLPSGFGRVSREVVSRLAALPQFELACLGWGYDGWPTAFPVALYPSPSSGYGRENFERVVNEFQPDVVVTLAEVWMIDWIVSHSCRGRFKWVAYVPLDSRPVYPPWVPLLQSTDALVAMAEFGRMAFREVLPSRLCDLIPHGVDTSVFTPLPGRAQIKSQDRVRGKFVVGCVARNQPRKNIPALVQAFAVAVQRNPLLHLYLHTSPCDVGHDLLTLLRRFRLEGCADIRPPEFSSEAGVTDAQLNLVYNLCDITVLPSMGEGFGLPIIESLAAGVPVVATDYSACRELVAGRGELARVTAMLTVGVNLMEYAVVDVEDLARCMVRLYVDRDLLAQYSKAGREFAEGLSWDRLIPKWVEIIERVSRGSSGA